MDSDPLQPEQYMPHAIICNDNGALIEQVPLYVRSAFPVFNHSPLTGLFCYGVLSKSYDVEKKRTLVSQHLKLAGQMY